MLSPLSLGYPVGPRSVDIIELMFRVTGNVAFDGVDIQTGIFNVGFDGVFDNVGDPADLIFGGAKVNPILEPNTALLVSVGLVLLRLRSRARVGGSLR